MPARATFTIHEIERAKRAVDAQLKAYDAVADAAEISPDDEDLNQAVDGFNRLFFNNLALALDRFFIDRDRDVTGSDGNPLNELHLICDSIMRDGGLFRTDPAIDYAPEKSILKFQAGDDVHLTADDFRRLSAGVFIELDEKFAEPA